MAAKSDKGNSSLKKSVAKKDVGLNKTSDKSKNPDKENDINFEDDEKVTKAGKKSAAVISKSKDDNEVNDIENEDDFANTGEVDEEDWDPDFDEFDLPKSSKKAAPSKKNAKDDDDEFKVDEEFQDFFNSSSSKKYKEDDDDDD